MTTTDIITAPNHELPLSGIVRPEGPQHTLWNVYNAMELMAKTIEDMVDDCAGFGVQALFKDCQTAIAYEADRVDFIMKQRKEPKL